MRLKGKQVSAIRLSMFKGLYLWAIRAEFVHLVYGGIPAKFFIVAEVVVGCAVGCHDDSDTAIP